MGFLLNEREYSTVKRPLLEVGTVIVATKNVGTVDKGQVGIITGVQIQQFFFWTRHMYLCTFVGSIKAAMKPNEVVVFDREDTLERARRR